MVERINNRETQQDRAMTAVIPKDLDEIKYTFKEGTDNTKIATLCGSIEAIKSSGKVSINGKTGSLWDAAIYMEATGYDTKKFRKSTYG